MRLTRAPQFGQTRLPGETSGVAITSVIGSWLGTGGSETRPAPRALVLRLALAVPWRRLTRPEPALPAPEVAFAEPVPTLAVETAAINAPLSGARPHFSHRPSSGSIRPPQT